MKNLELTQMEGVHAGYGPTPDDFNDAVVGTCVVVGIAASIATGFVTFGTSLFWGTSLTGALCAGVGAGAYLASE